MIETVVMIILAFVVALVLLYISLSYRRKPAKQLQPIQEKDRNLLQQYVSFYNELDKQKQSEFENRIQHFLCTVRITGINTKVERLDQLLIASSAIIPIFSFHNWQYMNLNEVLLYPG
ncbi:MAG: zinc-dependent peptidase, partial [Segetibacter sp.]|nr:zinc-dependent peptidase [Segetibacter sp.]